MTGRHEPRWWTMRRAQNLKAATYRCPLCGGHLPALSEHILLFPEGLSDGRRHAHTNCVRTAREQGKLPSREEWLRTQPRVEPFWAQSEAGERIWTRARRRLAERRERRSQATR